MHSEATLLQRIAAGDPSAVEGCLAKYRGLVWSIARRFAGNYADAEDAVQEVFIELWRHAARFDPALASESTFIGTIARRRLIDRKRRQSSRPQAAPMNADLIGRAAIGNRPFGNARRGAARTEVCWNSFVPSSAACWSFPSIRA